jgi:hypothetical protein
MKSFIESAALIAASGPHYVGSYRQCATCLITSRAEKSQTELLNFPTGCRE